MIQFAIPIEIVVPALVQKARWISATIDLQLVVGRLERLTQREHAALGRQVVALEQIAMLTSGQDIFPGGRTPTGFGNKVVEGQLVRFVLYAAILAGPFVTQEDVEPCEGGARLWLDIFFEGDHARHFHLKARRMDDLIIFGNYADSVKEHSFDGFLP